MLLKPKHFKKPYAFVFSKEKKNCKFKETESLEKLGSAVVVHS